jgi:hypothetical protein
MMMNRFINIANTVMGLPIYVLVADDWGQYQSHETAWHLGELELIMRRPTTTELVEILADYIQNKLLDADDVNDILAEDACSVRFELKGTVERPEVRVNVPSVEEIEEDSSTEDHPNIRLLVKRMETSLSTEDYAGVLHASASIFEVLAKDVVSVPSVENQPLGAFFERYRKDSALPEPVLDYILEIYKRRNTEPLAGHGQLTEPTITAEQAIILSEMTKGFIKIERKLALLHANPPEAKKASKATEVPM